jgi:uncharacterized membrane protein
MNTTRLEAFSDAVIAIVMTIMVLELKVPHGTRLEDLAPLLPVFLSYVLSFLYIGIYWNNHHHLLQAAETVDGHVLWANLHLLFWLSLFPFVTGWLGENGIAEMPVAAYGVVLLCAALAYTVLTRSLIARQGEGSALARSIGRDVKGWLSIAAYVGAIAIAFVEPMLSCGIYAAVAVLWFVPDRRIERNLSAKKR